MKFFYLLSPILFLCFDLQAQIKIKVLDAETGRSLPQASALHRETKQVKIADLDGEIYFEEQHEGKIEISFVGYRDQLIDLSPSQSIYNVYLVQEQRILEELTVIGFDSERKLLETPASIATLQQEDLFRYSESSLVPALNTIPGVRMEERAPGSYRLSIRGSLLRAPFGVRNVKVYWNDIPFTEPNGNTPLNLLDLNNMGRIEIIKGPASSIFGAGTGGVVNIQSERGSINENYVKATSMIGSYGLVRYATDLRLSSETSKISFNFTRHNAEGYRDHSTLDRKSAQLFAQFYPSKKRSLSASLFYSDLFYEIPGGLNESEYLENPRQARPLSEERNASIDLEMLQIGLSQDYRWNEKFGNVTSVYSTFSFFENPFITDYKRDAGQGMGGRSRFYVNSLLGSLPVKLTAGGELQHEKVVARNFGNVGGVADTLRFDDELLSTQSLLFTQAELDLPANFFLTLGMSYNRLKFDIYRLTDVARKSSYKIEKDFNPVIAPRLGLVKKLNADMAVHGSISYGFSPPTIDEVRTNEGSINEELEAEKGFNYEVGFRGSLWKNKIDFDITSYSFQLRETIVNRTDISSVVLFNNAGATSQKGIESLLNFYVIEDNQNALLSQLKLQNSTTFNYYKFREYQKLENDFSGNRLTGVAPFINVFSLDAVFKTGVYTHWTYNYTDEIPLNDANTVYGPDYHLMMAKVGFRKNLFQHMEADLYAGVDNLLDKTYSLGNDLNAFGGRYYQPSPGRNYFAGLRLKVNLDREL